MKKSCSAVKVAAILVLLAGISLAQNTATVSANLSFLTSNPAAGNVQMIMASVNCGGNNPRVISTWMILQPQPPFVPDASGHVPGTVIGNDKIDCGGTPLVSTCGSGQVTKVLAALKDSPTTAKAKAKFILATRRRGF
jgi:hypothetical protein